jgi:DNA-binding LacI/PurR family transcriptional regulator
MGRAACRSNLLISTVIKIALVSTHWSHLEYRFLAGALHYADTQSGVFIRPFAPCNDMADTATEVKRWGAKGVFGIIESSDLTQFVAAQSEPLPIVNFGQTNGFSNVTTIVGDFNVFLDKAVSHLRQLEPRSFGMFSLEEAGANDEYFINRFIEETRPANPKEAALILHVPHDIITDPDAEVRPVPEALATWLQALPKPAGIICPNFRGGNYLVRCCTALGVKVPEEVAIVSSDDLDFCLSCKPTLTSLLPSMEILGTKAAQLLMSILRGTEKPPQKVRVENTELIVRESTGRRRPEICDITAALAYIQTNATRGISVEQVVQETQRVSLPTFYNYFRKSTGKSPAEAIRDRQLQEVRHLLSSTELPLGMISKLCGFSSANVMARTFRIAEFMSPRDYRKRHKQK